MKNPLEEINMRITDLEKRETKIEAEEQEILSIDQHILEEVEKKQSEYGFASTLYRFRFLVSILLTVGVALVWQGVGKISEGLPLISTALGSLGVGLLILIGISWITKAK